MIVDDCNIGNCNGHSTKSRNNLYYFFSIRPLHILIYYILIYSEKRQAPTIWYMQSLNQISRYLWTDPVNRMRKSRLRAQKVSFVNETFCAGTLKVTRIQNLKYRFRHKDIVPTTKQVRQGNRNSPNHKHTVEVKGVSVNESGDVRQRAKPPRIESGPGQETILPPSTSLLTPPTFDRQGGYTGGYGS